MLTTFEVRSSLHLSRPRKNNGSFVSGLIRTAHLLSDEYMYPTLDFRSSLNRKSTGLTFVLQELRAVAAHFFSFAAPAPVFSGAASALCSTSTNCGRRAS